MSVFLMILCMVVAILIVTYLKVILHVILAAFGLLALVATMGGLVWVCAQVYAYVFTLIGVL